MKGILKPLALGALLGIILLIIQNIFKIPDAAFQKWVFVTFTVVIIASVAFNIFVVRKYQKRILKQIALLESGKQEAALLDMQEMLELAHKKGLKNIERICHLNITAALCDLKEYDKALELLKSMEKYKFKGNENFVYKLNLCACYFYLGKYEEGLNVYDNNYKVFQMFKDNPFYGGNVTLVTIWAMFALGEYDQARSMLKQAKEKWDKKRLYEDYRMLEKLLKDK